MTEQKNNKKQRKISYQVESIDADYLNCLIEEYEIKDQKNHKACKPQKDTTISLLRKHNRLEDYTLLGKTNTEE